MHALVCTSFWRGHVSDHLIMMQPADDTCLRRGCTPSAIRHCYPHLQVLASIVSRRRQAGSRFACVPSTPAEVSSTSGCYTAGARHLRRVVCRGGVR